MSNDWMRVVRGEDGLRDPNGKRFRRKDEKGIEFQPVNLQCSKHIVLRRYEASAESEPPVTVVIMGEVVNAKELGGKAYISFRTGKDVYGRDMEEDFCAEDLVEETARIWWELHRLIDQLTRERKKASGDQANKLDRKLMVAHALEEETSDATELVDKIRRKFHTEGKEGIAQYFSHGLARQLQQEHLIEVTLQVAKEHCRDKARRAGALPIDVCKDYLKTHKISGKPGYTPQKLSQLIASEKYQAREAKRSKNS